MLGSMALTSFLTGVTEPIEFSFMFLAPVLYALHAVMTGLSMALMDALGVKLGFGFSAGLFDYVINFGGSTRPLLMIPVGLAYGAVYYLAFSFAIRTFNLTTPGREPVAAGAAPAEAGSEAGPGAAWLAALGGTANLRAVGACTTRLRLEVEDADRLDEAALRSLGARGFVKPSPHTVQVIVGPTAELVAEQIRGAMDAAPAPAAQSHAPDAETAVILPDALADLLTGGRAAVARLVARNRLVLEGEGLPAPSRAALERLGLHRVEQAGPAHYLVTDAALLASLAGRS